MAAQPFTFTSSDGAEISAFRWDPHDGPRAIAQITHGMGEHVRRYDRLAAALNGRGYVVYGQDHRGHGTTAPSDDALGVLGEGGWGLLVEDIGTLATQARTEHPDLPLLLVAHSMGSFAAQQWLLQHSADVEAVVLTGTTLLDALEPGFDLDAPLDLTAFNVAFQPARTDYDWLSRDDAEVDLYVADDRCGFGLDLPGSKAMFAAARPIGDPAALAAIRSDLPVFIGAGELDPVNGNLALTQLLSSRLAEAGLTDVTVKDYPGARHELFNETNRADVTRDVLDWADAHLAAAPA